MCQYHILLFSMSKTDRFQIILRGLKKKFSKETSLFPVCAEFGTHFCYEALVIIFTSAKFREVLVDTLVRQTIEDWLMSCLLSGRFNGFTAC